MSAASIPDAEAIYREYKCAEVYCKKAGIQGLRFFSRG
jgi:hypothetical protein